MNHRSPIVFLLPLLICVTSGSAGERSGAEVRDAVRLYRTQNEVEILRELAGLVSLPNVATDLDDMEVNADRLITMLEAREFEARLLRAEGGPPAVFGQRLRDGAKMELWATDPFEVVVRPGRFEEGAQTLPFDNLESPVNAEWRLYGRSTSDDKVSIVALLAAIDALHSAGIDPSINIKIILDGEEERGSPHIAEILLANKKLLEADLWLFCDGPMHQTRLPQVVYGVRGVTSVHMTAYGAAVGLHSGHYGNWAPDSGMQLARLITSMRNAEGNITIDGIDHLVRPLSATAQAAIDGAPPVDQSLRHDLALGWTEGQPTPLAERITRPATNLLGFSVGQVGAKAKNAIPPQAKAVVGFRLVPDVTPDAIREAVEDHIRSQGFHIVHDEPDEATRRQHTRIVLLEWKKGYPALWTDMDLSVSKAVAQVVDEAVDGPIVLTPSLGGSLPIYVFSEILDGPPIIVVPIANHDNNQHAPNENLRIKNLWLGIEIYAALMSRL
jgi:acetylornithine deacetylase/succinyl-diaminopimelate desuccinylase-like protein